MFAHCIQLQCLWLLSFLLVCLFACLVCPGDIKATRMVIYGALLGVLDPVLTLAAAGDQDGTRMPNEAMMRASSEAASASVDGADNAIAAVTTGAGGRSPFQKARSMREERRLELAKDQASDHAVTLAAFQVLP